jgi:hypothetical protein
MSSAWKTKRSEPCLAHSTTINRAEEGLNILRKPLRYMDDDRAKAQDHSPLFNRKEASFEMQPATRLSRLLLAQSAG